jgi:hypothetical protein
LSVNTAGTYQVVVTDANGCSGNASVNISACISTVPNTQLRSVDCGKLNLVPGSQVACNAVAGATNYEFEFRDVVTNAVYATRVTTSTILAPGVVVPALNWNTQYQCRVRARVGGVWGNFSTSCIIGMAPNPAVVGVANTKLSAKWCNKSNIGLATTIDCIQISMANRYEFEFTDVLTSAVSTIQQSSKYLVLSSVTPALVAGHTYQVKVRARVSTTWGSFSDVCTLGIASSARYAEPEAVSTSTDETDETFAENAFEVKLYPNPVSTFMSLQMNKLPEENASVSIYNSIGALMYSAKLLNASQEIELSSLSAGIYFVFIQNGNETQNTRIIKK